MDYYEIREKHLKALNEALPSLEEAQKILKAADVFALNLNKTTINLVKSEIVELKGLLNDAERIGVTDGEIEISFGEPYRAGFDRQYCDLHCNGKIIGYAGQYTNGRSWEWATGWRLVHVNQAIDPKITKGFRKVEYDTMKDLEEALTKALTDYGFKL